MKPTLTMHGVESLSISPIEHFPQTSSYREEFWTRRVTFKSANGDSFTMSVFSNSPDGLFIDAQKRELTASSQDDEAAMAAIGCTF